MEVLLQEESAPLARQAAPHTSGSASTLKGCIEFINFGPEEKEGSSLLSAATAVALARRGCRIAYLIDVFGHAHADLFSRNPDRQPWHPVPSELRVAPGQVRVALQTHWTAGGPRATLDSRIRELSERQPEPERAGWLRPEAVETWERPLPPEHQLSPDERRRQYQARAGRMEVRRMLADGEAGDIVVIDSGHRPRVVGIPVDYTLVIRRKQPGDWKDLSDSAPWPPRRLAPDQAARRLADRIAQAPAGPWALAITEARPDDARDRDYFNAVGSELRTLGMTALDRVITVPYHEDLRDWRRPLRLRPHLPEYGGPVNAFRPDGFLTDGLDDLLTTVTHALHNRPRPR
ncbi:hypothetical protein [Streptomyces sp. NPDC057257]|uniref:hypothetical protein n=1 Tax=Streptomyces sp. NPDC057257 TaxID=3346071 RepID=UPI003640D21E